MRRVRDRSKGPFENYLRGKLACPPGQAPVAHAPRASSSEESPDRVGQGELIRMGLVHAVWSNAPVGGRQPRGGVQ